MKKLIKNKKNIKCYIDDFFEVKLPENYFQLVFTSPPYFVNKKYHDHDDTIIDKDSLYSFLSDSFKKAYRLTRAGGYIVFNVFDSLNLINYLFNEETSIGVIKDYSEYESPHNLMYKIMREAHYNNDGFFCLNYIWDKQVSDETAWGSFKSPSAVRSRTNHEFIYGFQKKGESHSKGQTDEIKNNEWMELTRSVISMRSIENRKNHPASFPIDLPKYFIQLLTHKGDPVLDPFAGTLTTLEACRQLEREGWGVEMSEQYVNVSFNKFPNLWLNKRVTI